LVDNVVVLPADTSLGQGPGPNQESARLPKQVHRQRANHTLDTAAHERPQTCHAKGSRSATSRCCVDARVQLPSHPAARRRSGPTWGAIRHLGGVILAEGSRKVNAMTWCFTCCISRGDSHHGGPFECRAVRVQGLARTPCVARAAGPGGVPAALPEASLITHEHPAGAEVVPVRAAGRRVSDPRAARGPN
jgi:hypothetical protein